MRRLLFLCCLHTSLQAQPLCPARVLSVTDGDTVNLKTSEGVRRVRLDSIDAPEKKQAFGNRSRQALRQLIPPGSQLQMLDLGQDRYQRTLAQLYLPDGTNVNALQVRNGHAWVFTRYCRDPAYWMPLQREAQRQHRGLWHDPSPIPPWNFRHHR
ncbi:MAG: thermonuclease family protein [Candidatus Eremiobacteraeota bacterium]|nr:thermonuclease family protein [Candidatus Eremiobacteraeota bacterium]